MTSGSVKIIQISTFVTTFWKVLIVRFIRVTPNIHPSLRFQLQLFTTFPLKSPAACLRVATDSPALQSCRAYDRLKLQAAPASGDFVEGWIIDILSFIDILTRMHGRFYKGRVILNILLWTKARVKTSRIFYMHVHRIFVLQYIPWIMQRFCFAVYFWLGIDECFVLRRPQWQQSDPKWYR